MAHSGGNLSHRFLVRYQIIADVRWVIEKFFLGGSNKLGTPELVCAATQRPARRSVLSVLKVKNLLSFARPSPISRVPKAAWQDGEKW
jgi:hypothetical protein